VGSPGSIPGLRSMLLNMVIYNKTYDNNWLQCFSVLDFYAVK